MARGEDLADESTGLRLRRIGVYLNRMFPPAATLPYLIAYGLAAYFGLQAVAGRRPLQLTWRAFAAALSIFLLGLLMRVYDEFKDADADRGRRKRIDGAFPPPRAPGPASVTLGHLRLRRALAPEASEDERCGADLDAIAAGKFAGVLHELALDIGSVVAPEILDGGRAIGDDDPRVAARHAVQVDPDHGIRIATEGVVARYERDLAVSPGDPAVKVGHRGHRPRIRPDGTNLGEEGVAEAVDCANIPGFLGLVAETTSQNLDQPGEAALRDERVGPKLILQLVFGERLRTRAHEDFEQPICLRLDVHELPFA
jgi:hypothetical protein